MGINNTVSNNSHDNILLKAGNNFLTNSSGNVLEEKSMNNQIINGDRNTINSHSIGNTISNGNDNIISGSYNVLADSDDLVEVSEVFTLDQKVLSKIKNIIDLSHEKFHQQHPDGREVTKIGNHE